VMLRPDYPPLPLHALVTQPASIIDTLSTRNEPESPLDRELWFVNAAASSRGASGVMRLWRPKVLAKWRS